MKWIQLLRTVGLPVLLAVVSRYAPIIPIILSGIEEAEQLHGAQTGATKKAHVLGLVAAGAAALKLTGKVTIDPEAAVAAASTAIDATIDVVNRLHQAPVTP